MISFPIVILTNVQKCSQEQKICKRTWGLTKNLVSQNFCEKRMLNEIHFTRIPHTHPHTLNLCHVLRRRKSRESFYHIFFLLHKICLRNSLNFAKARVGLWIVGCFLRARRSRRWGAVSRKISENPQGGRPSETLHMGAPVGGRQQRSYIAGRQLIAKSFARNRPFRKICPAPSASWSLVLKMKKLLNDGLDLTWRPSGGKKRCKRT